MLKHRKKAKLLTYEERLFIARKLYEGLPRKQAAHDFDVSITYIHFIFKEFLKYRIVWRRSHWF